MTQLAKTLEIRSSPHIASGAGTDAIMFNVALALLPTSLFAVYRFGLAGLLVLIVAVLVCLLTGAAWPVGWPVAHRRWGLVGRGYRSAVC